MLYLYSVTNRYLSPIQKGIQTAHAVVNMLTYQTEDPQTVEWAKENGTIRVLETRSSAMMGHIMDLLVQTSKHFGCFREPEISNTVTAICFVVDECDFERYKDFSNRMPIEVVEMMLNPHQQYTEEDLKEFELLGILKSLRSAT